MQIEYTANDKKLEWGSVSLSEFLDEYTPNGWESFFEGVAESIPNISDKLQDYSQNNTIYPPMHLLFNSFDALRPQDIKIVLIAQDPYINKNEAMGWSFSVPENSRVPASLRNIFKELDNEGFSGYKNKNGDLTDWVKKGVFLYNSCLTVNKSKSGSHGDLWLDFSNSLINFLNDQCNNIAWVLLGAKAKQYSKLIDNSRHGVFKAGHPSPLNKSGGFIGSNVFLNAENYLKQNNIDFTWNL